MLGLFFAHESQSMRGLSDAPYAAIGRHALCAQRLTSDGGAMAAVIGPLRGAQTLKKRLEEAGVLRAPDPTDAALVLAAYRLWGADYPRRLEGPCATAVIDCDKNRLILSRDRIGDTRLFYAAKNAQVAFSEHPAPLLRAPFVSRAVDADGLRELFALGPARTPGVTPWRDIRALGPGCYLIADADGQRVQTYFRLEPRAHEEDTEATVLRVRALIRSAARECLRFGPGSMLSGGVDSSVLTALLCENTPSARTYSVTYENDEQDYAQNDYQHERDAPFIERAVRFLGCENERVTLAPAALLDELQEAVRRRGFPGMADVDTSLLLFGREIARREEAVLSGECGDEVFGGYPWFHREDLIARDGFPWSGSLALRESVLKPSVRARLRLTDYAQDRYREALNREPALDGEDKTEARLRAVYGLCLKWFMPNLQERALCMLSPLRVLTPYSDDRLVRYLYNVPWSIKNLGGVEKGLLRQAMKGLLPDELLLRKKSPYPKTHNPVYARLVSEKTLAMLDDASSPLRALLDADALRSLIEKGLRAADTPWYGQLMTGPQMLAYLLQVDLWMREYGVEWEID